MKVVPVRHCFTEEEHELMTQVGNDFWKEFGELAAKHIMRMPIEVEDLATCYLQDLCSIYGSNYSAILDQRLERK